VTASATLLLGGCASSRQARIDSTVPPNIGGTEQSLRVAPPLSERLVGYPVQGPGHYIAGSEHTYRIDRTATFTVERFIGQAELSSEPPGPVGTAFHVGDGAGGAEQVDHVPAEFTDTNWPLGGKQLTVWSGVPATATYVTLCYEHRTLAWQRPLFGTVGFVIPLITTYRDTPTGLAHMGTNPSFAPILRAYDSGGSLVSQFIIYVNGPLAVYPNT
jgi:hypothetical protein